jgi:nucleotide-binding universal stress UspA family protein
VVVGASARGGAHPLTLGGVSDAVASGATCDVLVVRAQGSAKREVP